MATEGFGPWEPIGLDEIVHLFRTWPGRWWITGGVALELHLGRSWRGHADSDVSILREDASGLADVMPGWDIHVAAAGVLTPWDGSNLAVQSDQNNLWCRPSAGEPWCLDVTISEGDQDCWIYRRDPGLRVPWDDAVLRSERGIPYLAPELQLLFKSEDNRDKDDQDAAVVIPALSPERKRWLSSALSEDHPWQALCPQ